MKSEKIKEILGEFELDIARKIAKEFFFEIKKLRIELRDRMDVIMKHPRRYVPKWKFEFEKELEILAQVEAKLDFKELRKKFLKDDKNED